MARTATATVAKVADGTKVSLTFGSDYIFGISGPTGRDDVVAGRLDSRGANGDLVVLVDSSGTTRRIRPSKILSYENAGGTVVDFPTDSRPLVPDRLDDETTSAYLARLETELGDRYASWIATDTGQATLELVAAEDRAARKDSLRRAGIVGGKTPAIGPKPIGAIFGGLPHTDPGPELASIPFVESPTRVVRTTAKGRAKLAELGVADPNPTGTSWKDRNRVWKCGSCGRRLRLASCTGRPDGSHPPVSAPAGSRKETR